MRLPARDVVIFDVNAIDFRRNQHFCQVDAPAISKAPISCYIRTKNEGRNIARTIRAALRVADEVVIIDSGSTDDTVAASEAAGARVVHSPWQGWGKQKRVGEDACRNDWLLDLDADEIVTRELAAEIATLFANGAPAHSVYEMRMATAPPVGEPWRKFNLAKRQKLYDRRAVRQPDHENWDQFKIPPGVDLGHLEKRLMHRSFNDLAQLENKFNRNSSDGADTARLPPLWVCSLRMLLGKPGYFVNQYFRRGLWRAGWYGFAVANIAAHGRWLKDAKRVEIHLRNRDIARARGGALEDDTLE